MDSPMASAFQFQLMHPIPQTRLGPSLVLDWSSAWHKNADVVTAGQNCGVWRCCLLGGRQKGCYSTLYGT